MSNDISAKFLSAPQDIITGIPITCKLLSTMATRFKIYASDNGKNACVVPDPSGFQATFLPYIKTAPQFINVNKSHPANNIIFTAALSGCSIYVTDVGDGTINVWHDPRTEHIFNTGDVYDRDQLHIIADFSFNKYSDSILASAIMLHNGAYWTIFGQKLVVNYEKPKKEALPYPPPFDSVLWEDFYPKASVTGIIVP